MGGNSQKYVEGEVIEVNYQGTWVGAHYSEQEARDGPDYCSVVYNDTPGRIMQTRVDNIKKNDTNPEYNARYVFISDTVYQQLKQTVSHIRKILGIEQKLNFPEG